MRQDAPGRAWSALAGVTIAMLLIGMSLVSGCRTLRQDTGRAATTKESQPVILVSIDGFRWDYLSIHEAPVIRAMAGEGVWADRGMTAVFPTKTFPNHYSLVTGLYPEHHGVVGNTMYDPGREVWFRLSDRDAVTDPQWWGGEPIWVTAEKQGVTSATYFWPGSEAPIQGVRPTYWKEYDGRVPGEERVAQVLDWLDMPEGERPAFITLYFSEVDSRGHTYGPEAPETAEAVRRVDALIGRLADGLRERALYDEVNLILVSDHGMAQLSEDRVIFLEDYIDVDDVLVVDSGALVALRPNPGREGAVYDALAGAHPNLRVFRRQEVPERLHYRAHDRITPIVGIPDPGWYVFGARSQMEERRDGLAGGAHGYDNRHESMRALFVARGPAFVKGQTVEPFENVQLYNVMAEILRLRPAPNDGDPGAMRQVLAR